MSEGGQSVTGGAGSASGRRRPRRAWRDGAGPAGVRVAVLALVVAMGGALPVGCASRAARTAAPAVPAASAAPAAPALLLDPGHAEWSRPAPAVSHLRFETTKGVFVLELVRAYGAIGADRLYNLARLGYYDDTRVHRVRAGYIAQFGLHGDPAVNAAWQGRTLADDPPRSENRRGTFAFAYEGPGRPNTRNTQLYINLADNPRNDAEPFTVLGRVVQGMDVVDALYAGYGEGSGGGVRQGRQGPLARGGNAFMDREYPRLDRIIRVTVQAVRR